MIKNGIGSILPMQTITLPNGQTVQIPEINMEEVNANLLAAGITPQSTPPSFQPTTSTSELDLPVSMQPESITELAASQAKFAQPSRRNFYGSQYTWRLQRYGCFRCRW